MRIPLAFGRGFHEIDCPDHKTTIIEPREGVPLLDEKASFLHALEHPIGSPPFHRRLRRTDRVMISFTDNTRATPNERIIPWLLEVLGDHPRDRIILINQLGTHRPNTRAELEEMLTPEVVADYEVVNHDCENEAELVTVGEMNDGTLLPLTGAWLRPTSASLLVSSNRTSSPASAEDQKGSFPDVRG